MEAANYTARSLFVVYKQLPEDTQKAFKALIDNDKEEGYMNSEWVAFSSPSLAELWDAPEEDYWDELYAKQRANG
jgi:hypothetical protein